MRAKAPLEWERGRAGDAERGAERRSGRVSTSITNGVVLEH